MVTTLNGPVLFIFVQHEERLGTAFFWFHSETYVFISICICTLLPSYICNKTSGLNWSVVPVVSWPALRSHLDVLSNVVLLKSRIVFPKPFNQLDLFMHQEHMKFTKWIVKARIHQSWHRFADCNAVSLFAHNTLDQNSWWLYSLYTQPHKLAAQSKVVSY